MRQSAAACILLGVAVVLTLTAIVLPLTRTLLVQMETPPEIMDGAYDFISIVFAGLVIFLLLYLQNCLIRALGDSKMPTILLAVTLGINIALEPVAILVLGWGIPGAAGATVFSQGIGALLFWIYIRRTGSLIVPFSWHICVWDCRWRSSPLSLPSVRSSCKSR